MQLPQLRIVNANKLGGSFVTNPNSYSKSIIVFDVNRIHAILIMKDKMAEIGMKKGGPFDDLVLNLISIANTNPGKMDSQPSSLYSPS